MTTFVSNRWMRVTAMVAPMSIAWLIFILHGSPWAGFVWMSLAFAAVLWPVRATPVPNAVLRSKGSTPRRTSRSTARRS
ncbi:MAG: hypothetical protein DMF80_08550 [Acidobacteria bacterium]|nr:MAG: hypothetical protein DMF80_08550 [Acidobacteriota bacterium]PYQ23671.1 MAG: hypothetical protein DMF81_08080 [Acidobacteriota bacterium]